MTRGLYVHIPFCKQKCNYCDFASFAGQEKQIDVYLDALQKEAAQYRAMPCQTLYIGGGTPSLLTTSQLQRLVEIICQNFSPIETFIESTFEANPESLTQKKLTLLHKVGFNRLSIGLQSFNDDELKTLGRVHNAKEFLQVYQHAKDSGFENINVDLIAGLPGQTLGSFLESLQRLMDLRPQHISVYGLQIEEGTPFFQQGVVCDQDLMRSMLEQAHLRLTQEGYVHYEISNYALPGKQSVHNTNYWQNGEYVGIGSAAASYQKGTRWQNTPSVQEYISRLNEKESPVVFSERLTGKAKVGETLLLALRQLDGVALSVEQQTLFGKEIEKHIKNGLLICVKKKVKLSKEGLYLANEVFRSFVAPFEDA